MVSYYPEAFNINKIVKAYPELEMVDEEEEERLADVADRRRRGKGAPKKAKTKGWGRWSFFLRGSICADGLFFLLPFSLQLIVGGRIGSDKSLYYYRVQIERGQLALCILTQMYTRSLLPFFSLFKPSVQGQNRHARYAYVHKCHRHQETSSCTSNKYVSGILCTSNDCILQLSQSQCYNQDIA